MKINKFIILKWILAFIYLVIVYFFVLKMVQPELHFYVLQPPFLSVSEFFHPYTLYPGGISEFVGNFLMQFFAIEFLGALLVIFISGLMALFIYLILKKALNNYLASVLTFISLVLPAVLMNSYVFPFSVVIKILISYYFVYIYSLINRKFLSLFLFLVFSSVVYYLSGSGSFIVFCTSIFILEALRKFSIKKLMYMLGILFVALILPYFSYKYIFNIAPSAKYFSFLPNLPNFISYKPSLLFYLFVFSLPIVLIITKLSGIWIHKLKCNLNSYLSLGILSLLVLFIVASLFAFTYNKHEKNKVLAGYYSCNERWIQLIDLANNDPQYDIFINYHYNRAISYFPNYIDLYFNYPQYLGSDGLFPDKYNAKEIALLSSDFYYDLGYIGLSQLWANEALTAFPYSSRILQRLFNTSIILGNYDEATKYLEILSYNFLNADFVAQNKPYLQDTSLIIQNKEWMAKRSFTPFKLDVAGNNMIPRFNDLLNKNIGNKEAYDNLQLYHMLRLKLDDFYKNLSFIKNFHSQMPLQFELATIMYLLQTDQTNLINNRNFTENALSIFKEFTNVLKEKNKNEAQATLKKRFGKTYLYYMMYDNPLVTKFELKRQAINTHKY